MKKAPIVLLPAATDRSNTGTRKMRMFRILSLTLLLATLLPAALSAGVLDGIVKVGYVFLDETAGDLSVIQESYNIHENFSISQFKLYGNPTPKSYFSLNLTDINNDNRKAAFDFKIPGQLKFRATFDQHRQVFEASKNLVSRRKDAHFSLDVTPAKGLGLSALYNVQNRGGERSSYPALVESHLGNRYDYLLTSGRIEGRGQFKRRHFAVALDFSDFADDNSNVANRQGRMISARIFSPCLLTDKITHSMRGAYGKQEMSDLDLRYTLGNFQYMGEVRPDKRFKLGYTFFASRVDDEVTEIKTDNIRNSFDGEYRHPYGSLFGGYSYETNDDDRTLTTYNVYRAGATIRYSDEVDARIRYTNRTKDDEEKRTLLQESETQSFLASISFKPIEGLKVGGRYMDRNRDLPDIEVEIDGRTYNVFAGYSFRDWGSLRTDYTYAKNKYDDRIGSFETLNHTITSRVQIDYIENLALSAGLAYIDIGKDLDIEKSTLFFEAQYTHLDRYHIEIKYDVYNFDDYVLVDRYYTANVLWVNIGYSFQVE
jgi:hypothetical protein